MEVTTSSGKRINQGQVVVLADLRAPPDVDWPELNNDHLYTIALWNATASDAPRMHFLAVNAPTQVRIVIPYKPPTADSLNDDTYQLAVFQQDSSFPVYSARSHSNFKFPMAWRFTREVGIRDFHIESSHVARADTTGHHATNGHATTKTNGGGYFNLGHSLTPGQEKFCRCTLHVMAKQPEHCLKTHEWGPGTDCYNPYSVCAKSTRTSVGRSSKCTDSYDFSGIPDNELQAYAVVEGVSVPSPYIRSTMIANLETWRSGKAGK